MSNTTNGAKQKQLNLLVLSDSSSSGSDKDLVLFHMGDDSIIFKYNTRTHTVYDNLGRGFKDGGDDIALTNLITKLENSRGKKLATRIKLTDL